MATRDLANLNLLRTVGVGLVFVGHLTATMRVRALGDLGHFGVLLFFVHTALVLMFSMERLALSGTGLYASFVIRRIFRIYPLSVLTVLLVVVLRVPSTSWGTGFVWPGWPGLLSNILLTQNITHSGSVDCVLCSLPFEVQMYAVLPLLYILIQCFTSLRSTLLIWLVTAAIAGLEYWLRGPAFDSDFLLLRYFPCFLAGVFAWRLLATRGGGAGLPGWLWVLVLMALVFSYRVEDALRVYGPGLADAFHGVLRNDHRIYLPPYLDLVRDWVFCGITGLALPFFSEITSRWLNVVTKRVAQYSYGIYVCHVPIQWLCITRLHAGNVVVGAFLSVLLTVLVSVVLYHCVEHPGIQCGKRLATRLVSGIALKVRATG